MIIDTEKTGSLMPAEAVLLLFLKECSKTISLEDIKQTLLKLDAKGYCGITKTFNTYSVAIRKKGEEYLREMGTFTKNEKDTVTQNRCISLSDRLRQLYPEGKKPGLQEYWRDSTNVIAERLKKFFEKYGEHTDEEIIEATKQYVAHFNGNYRYMKLLKYFIWKQVVKGGELVEGRMVGEVEKESELLSYIQNLRETPQPSFSADWDVQLK